MEKYKKHKSQGQYIRKSFQVILSEFDNGIQFTYGPEVPNTQAQLSYSIGLTNQTGGINIL